MSRTIVNEFNKCDYKEEDCERKLDTPVWHLYLKEKESLRMNMKGKIDKWWDRKLNDYFMRPLALNKSLINPFKYPISRCKSLT